MAIWNALWVDDKKDIRESKKFNVLIVRNYWGGSDYLIGTYNSLLSFMIDYLGYDMNNDYLKALYIESK